MRVTRRLHLTLLDLSKRLLHGLLLTCASWAAARLPYGCSAAGCCTAGARLSCSATGCSAADCFALGGGLVALTAGGLSCRLLTEVAARVRICRGGVLFAVRAVSVTCRGIRGI